MPSFLTNANANANANAKLSDQRQRQRQRQAFWPWQKHGQARRPARTPNRQPRNDFNSPPTQQASPIGEPRASKKQSSERPGIGKGAARGGPGKPLPVGQRHSHLPAIPRVWEIAPARRPERLRAGRTANVRGYRGRKQPGLARRSGIAGLPVKKFRPCGPPTLVTPPSTFFLPWTSRLQ